MSRQSESKIIIYIDHIFSNSHRPEAHEIMSVRRNFSERKISGGGTKFEIDVTGTKMLITKIELL